MATIINAEIKNSFVRKVSLLGLQFKNQVVKHRGVKLKVRKNKQKGA